MYLLQAVNSAKPVMVTSADGEVLVLLTDLNWYSPPQS